MNTKSITEFSEAVAASPELQTKLQAIHADAARETAEKLAALSTEAGYPFSAEEFLAASSPATPGEISDEQLEAVAGGVWAPSEGNVLLSIFTAGLGCLAAFNASLAFKNNPDGCQVDATQPRNRPGYGND